AISEPTSLLAAMLPASIAFVTLPAPIAVAPWVPEISPANAPEKLVAVVAVVAELALPDKFAVIVPAEKFPEASRATIALFVLTEVAVVAEFATFPAVEIAGNCESEAKVKLATGVVEA